MNNKKTVLFDFDGVIHSYSGWKGLTVIDGQPVKGIKETIKEIREEYRVVVYSTRCNEKKGEEAVAGWLRKNDIEVDDIVNKKIPALVQVDDRCICFDGNSGGLVDKIKNFEVWYR